MTLAIEVHRIVRPDEAAGVQRGKITVRVQERRAGFLRDLRRRAA
jgi:hypothetical protein